MQSNQESTSNGQRTKWTQQSHPSQHTPLPHLRQPNQLQPISACSLIVIQVLLQKDATARWELIIDESKFKDQGGKATHLIPHILQLNCEVYCIGSSHYLPALHTLPSMSSGGIAIRRNLQLSCGSHYLSTLLPCYNNNNNIIIILLITSSIKIRAIFDEQNWPPMDNELKCMGKS